jgi:hypothetical protein
MPGDVVPSGLRRGSAPLSGGLAGTDDHDSMSSDVPRTALECARVLASHPAALPAITGSTGRARQRIGGLLAGGVRPLLWPEGPDGMPALPRGLSLAAVARPGSARGQPRWAGPHQDCDGDPEGRPVTGRTPGTGRAMALRPGVVRSGPPSRTARAGQPVAQPVHPAREDALGQHGGRLGPLFIRGETPPQGPVLVPAALPLR